MKYLKIIGGLVVVIIFLLACIGSIIGVSGAIFLNTYAVFTERTPVANVTISALKHDENGDYADVKFQNIAHDSALAALFGQADSTKVTNGDEVDYKIYGDTIYVSGPIIKFKDPLILINFKTIYKLGKLYGRYDLDNSKQTSMNATAQSQSSYDVNGGFADWKAVFDSINADNLQGKFDKLFIDTTQISSAGVFISGADQKYTIYMTNLGFLWQQD